MITRLWHGWTTPENATAYEDHLRSRILHRIDGYRGPTCFAGSWVPKSSSSR